MARGRSKKGSTAAKVQNKKATRAARQHAMPRPARKAKQAKVAREVRQGEAVVENPLLRSFHEGKMTDKARKQLQKDTRERRKKAAAKKKAKAEKAARGVVRHKAGLMSSGGLAFADANAASASDSSSSDPTLDDDDLGDADLSAMRSFLTSLGHAVPAAAAKSADSGATSSSASDSASSSIPPIHDSYGDTVRHAVTWDETAKGKLPVKTAEGTIRAPTVRSMYAAAEAAGDTAPLRAPWATDADAKGAGSGSGSGSDSDADDGRSETKRKALTPAVARHRRNRLLARKKRDIGDGVELLLADPEANIAGLSVLLDLAKKDIDPAVRRFAVAGLTTVFKDILPAYRIRTSYETEAHTIVSRAVAALRGYEVELASCYQAFVQHIDSSMANVLAAINVVDEATVPAAARIDAQLFVGSICTLVTSKPRFNYTTDLLKWVLRGVNSKNANIAAQCYAGMKEVFRVDGEKEATLAAVGLIASLLKAKQYSTSPKLLRLFAELELLDAVPDAVSLDGERKSLDQVLRPNLSNRQKKELKARRKREREFAARSATLSLYERQMLQTDILSRIMLAYFRILKNAPTSKLLPAVLAGLEKHAHLVNIEFTDDLFAALADIATRTDVFLLSRCYAINTAFSLVSGIGSAFRIDLSAFFTAIYILLRQVTARAAMTAPGSPQYLTLGPVLKAILANLEGAFRYLGRELATPRVAALLKRLAALAAVVPVNYTLAYVWLIRSTIAPVPLLHQLLESEKSAMGTFDPESDNPHHCNGLAATLHELFALADSHWHPKVREIAAATVALEPLAARQIRIKPARFIRAFSIDGGTFNPPVPPPTPHSLKRVMTRVKRRSPGKAADRVWFLPATKHDAVGPSPLAATLTTPRAPPPKSSTIFAAWHRAHAFGRAAISADLARSAAAAQLADIKRLHAVFLAVRKRKRSSAPPHSAKRPKPLHA